jgi:HTH-type transcriptional regulator / antitoxin HigA
MDIKPIKTDQDYDTALAQIAALMNAVPGSPEGDRLDVMVTLVEAYEAQHFPIESPDPIGAIEFVMEQRGLSRKDLESYIGNRHRISEIMNHKRSLTLPMIRKLHQGLGIPAEVLIGN